MRTYTLFYNSDRPARNEKPIFCYEDQEKTFTSKVLTIVSNLWKEHNFQRPNNIPRKVHEDILSELLLTLLCEYGPDVPFYFLRPRRIIIKNEKDESNTFGVDITCFQDFIETSIFHTQEDDDKFTDEQQFDYDEVLELEKKWHDHVLANMNQ